MPSAHAMPFPSIAPEGYPALMKEPEFDPSRHLALERPEKIVTLSDLGYGEDEIAGCPTELGITSVFRVLSDEGAACLLEVARNLAPYARTIERVPRMVRGGTYQSKFLRDLCLCPEITEMISELCGAPMLPHTIPHQLGHLNYNPLTVGQNVDKWHTDTLRVDYVMFVTDPNGIEGGEFEYFHGTRHEMKELTDAGKLPPLERSIAPELPGPGYAVLQQGNKVVHRAKALTAEGERITMVNGYVPGEIGFPDFTRFDQLSLADPEHVCATEYARHVAWMGGEMLRDQIERPAFNSDRDAIAGNLEAVAATLAHAAEEIRKAGTAKMEHFGDG